MLSAVIVRTNRTYSCYRCIYIDIMRCTSFVLTGNGCSVKESSKNISVH